MAKVFVSHRGVDAAPAERLATELRAAGHDVWFDDWEILAGDSVVGRIDAGLASADFLVLCLSAHPDGVHTPWMLAEWVSAYTRQLEGHGVRVLPVRLTGGELPSVLADRKAADLVTDWQAGVAALLRAIDTFGRRAATR